MSLTDDIEFEIHTLRGPYRDAILAAVAMPGADQRRRLNQIIIGPPHSGKSTEARDYADALRALKLVDDKAPVILDDIPNTAEKTRALFDGAKNKVLIIDEIYSRFGLQSQSQVERFLLEAVEEAGCAVLLTGDAEPMKDFLKGMSAPLKARLPRPIETERSFASDEMAVFAEQRRQDKLVDKEEKRRAFDLARHAEEWRKLAEDVTLKRLNMKPMKPLVFARRNDTAS